MSFENEYTVQPFSQKDRQVVSELKYRAYYRLVKSYGLFFLGLAYAYFQILPGQIFHGRKMTAGDLTRSDYNHVYEIFFIFFGVVFLYFLVKDYRRTVVPINRELRTNKKNCIYFIARKYQDPIYHKCLIFYPGKENVYIEMDEDEYRTLSAGEKLYLETGTVSGEIFLLKNETTEFKTASEYNFSEA